MVAAIASDPDVLYMKQMGASLSMLATLAGIVSALSGPLAPIVIPIAAGLVVGHWSLLIFKQANIVLQRLMTYIVALTIIMQTIFVVTTSTNNVVTRRLIKLALKTFLESSQTRVINSIKEPLGHFGRDAALQRVTELLKSESNRISLEEMARIKIILKDFQDTGDEPW